MNFDFLLAPFTNRTNLFTIIVLTVLFAVFRLSGGSIFGAGSPTPTSEGDAFYEDSSPLSSPEGTLFDRILGGRNDEEVEKPARRGEGQERYLRLEEPEEDVGLDDIEKALGLR